MAFPQATPPLAWRDQKWNLRLERMNQQDPQTIPSVVLLVSKIPTVDFLICPADLRSWVHFFARFAWTKQRVSWIVSRFKKEGFCKQTTQNHPTTQMEFHQRQIVAANFGKAFLWGAIWNKETVGAWVVRPMCKLKLVDPNPVQQDVCGMACGPRIFGALGTCRNDYDDASGCTMTMVCCTMINGLFWGVF